jgi:hypothetical protein
MASTSSEPNAHRHNSNGSWDSICKLCFFTIATHPEETDLEPEEKTHDCRPYVLGGETRGRIVYDLPRVALTWPGNRPSKRP